MPFRSQQQRKFMYATMPKIAKRWASHTKNIKALPKYAKRSGRSK